MSSRSRDPTHPRSKQQKQWRTVYVDMKAKSTSRLPEHFFVQFTVWAQRTLTGFLHLQVALNERTRAPLNTLQGLCSALWHCKKSDIRCIFSCRAAEKINIDRFLFLRRRVLPFSAFTKRMEPRIGWEGSAGVAFSRLRRNMVSFRTQ